MRKAPAVRAARVAQVPKSARPSAAPSSLKIREDLSVEFFALVRLALSRLGVTGGEQERAIERSRHLKTAPHVSGPLLRDTRGLCALLLEWSRDGDYVDPDGKPRVLAIKGAGATFERLARRFLPKKPLKDVVAMACATAEVATRPGGKIALLGSIMVSVAKSPDNLLAHAIRQIDQLLETILHNAIVNRKGLSNGHMERMVLGVISAKEFDGFMSELRPQIYDLLQRVDSSVQQRQPKSTQSLRDATAVSVGVYVAREDDWDRAGIDARPLVARVPRRRKST